MHATGSILTRAGMAALVGACALVGTGLVSAQLLPLDAIKEHGEAVTAAYEGWFYTPDKKKALLIGFWNRNTKQVLDIPVGPNNRIEPGGPDYGQPTHFEPRRGWGTFSIVLPETFTEKDKMTWTLIANGKTTAIPMGLNIDYIVEPYRETGMGNTPPILKFDPTGKTFTGPPIGIGLEKDRCRQRRDRADRLGERRWNRGSAVPAAGHQAAQRPMGLAPSAGRRRGQVRGGPAEGGSRRGRQGIHHRHLLDARRVHPARPGHGPVRRGRRRVPVLLDLRAGEGHGQVR